MNKERKKETKQTKKTKKKNKQTPRQQQFKVLTRDSFPSGTFLAICWYMLVSILYVDVKSSEVALSHSGKRLV